MFLVRICNHIIDDAGYHSPSSMPILDTMN
jgi:hypothetical protein